MPITSFTASPTQIKKGETATLKWTTEGCDNCVLLPLPGFPQGKPVESNGSLKVSPDYSRVYMISCKCGAPPSEWTTLVIVEDS